MMFRATYNASPHEGAGKPRSKLSSNLLPRTVTWDRCPQMCRTGRRPVASRTAPNSEVEAELGLDQHIQDRCSVQEKLRKYPGAVGGG